MSEKLVTLTENSESSAGLGGDMDRRDSLSLLELINSVLRHRMAIVFCALGLAFVAALGTLLAPRTFTSSTTFIPQAKQSPSAISGLAAQFGVSVAAGDPGTSPAFYEQLVGSKEIRSDVVAADYTSGAGATRRKGQLADVLEIAGADSLVRRSKAISALSRATTTVLDQKSSVISVAVSMPSADLARQVALQYINAINRFNLDRRQSQAASERQFTERRLAEVQGQLRQAEDQLQYFLQRNRLMDTPDLVFQRERLGREVALRQQVYGTIAQAHEQARIDEVRDTPVLTILDHPEAPIRPDPRGVAAKTLIALIIGFCLAAAGAVIRDNLAGRDPSALGMVEFARLRSEAANELRHPISSAKRSWRRVREKRSATSASRSLHLDSPS